ncbi:MAG: metallophosphoesterase [Bacteroidales bacterium]
MAKIHYIYGTVNSAKTTDLITKAFFMREIGINVVCMIPQNDTRSEGVISSRTGLIERDVQVISKDTVIDKNILNSDVDVLFIDEVQFLHIETITEIIKLANKYDIQVFAYGLRTDFKKEIFPAVSYLLAHATDIQEMKSYCSVCTSRKSIYNAKMDKFGHIVTSGPSISPGFNYDGVCSDCYDYLQEKRNNNIVASLSGMNVIRIDKPIYVTGDVHGEFKTLVHQIKTKCCSDCVVVVAGDCGIGFTSRAHIEQELRMLSKRLEPIGVEVLFVRGNHDNPEFFNDNPINVGCFRTIPDYTVLSYVDRFTKEQKFTLCVGGGISIDRVDRIKNDLSDKKHRKSYWADEPMVYNEDKLSHIRGIKFNSLITHVNPFVNICDTSGTINHYLSKDVNLSDDLSTERTTAFNLFKFLVESCEIDTILHGHYHVDYTQELSIPNIDCMGRLVIMKGMRDLKTYHNMSLVCINR